MKRNEAGEPEPRLKIAAYFPWLRVGFGISRHAFSHFRHTSAQSFKIGSPLFSQRVAQRLQASSQLKQMMSWNGPSFETIREFAEQIAEQSWQARKVGRYSFLPSTINLAQ
jgi:hypothetical protein